ncbi:LysM peptidoglycan-binding domain-containing protein [Hyphococcus lacteus]|uniref:LysM peptidoglycan-binding domain-containing protein n=1 Tax=Hyphococcus lacteus TaxID=3143536 RepID=A0ABV3Z692_9PROT
MAELHIMRRGAAIAVLIAGVAVTSPAVAGRCGHSYPVDAPTTLSKVARACNVSLAALKEANRGVDPNYVRPGEHLAVPDETDYPGDVPTVVTEVAEPDPVYNYTPSPWPTADARPNKVVRTEINSSETSGTGAFYLEASTGRLPVREASHLSYQQQSAARIRNAGLTMRPVRSYNKPETVTVSSVSKVPLSALMECSVLRRQPNGKIGQVREFKPLPEGRDAPSHCMQLTSADATAIGSVTHSAPLAFATETALRGFVSFADEECITLRAEDGMEWRVASDARSRSLVGKEATIWADFTDAKSCGGLVMDRAIYVERLAVR